MASIKLSYKTLFDLFKTDNTLEEVPPVEDFARHLDDWKALGSSLFKKSCKCITYCCKKFFEKAVNRGEEVPLPMDSHNPSINDIESNSQVSNDSEDSQDQPKLNLDMFKCLWHFLKRKCYLLSPSLS